MGCSCASERQKSDENSDKLYIQIINDHISEYKLLVYTNSSCTNSKQVKELLRKEGIEFEYFDLDKLSEGKKILHALEKLTVYKSPPYIFYNKLYIGGLSECRQLLPTLTNL